jgi:hypothetical protein
MHNKAKRNNKQKNKKTNEVTRRIPKPIGVPDTQFTVLRYVDTISFTGSSAQYTFRANSLFDPDFTSAGHQPYYFDQYIAIYEKYRVFKTHCTLRCTNISQTTPSEVVLIPVSQIPTLTSLTQAREIPRAVPSGILPAFQSLPKTISLSLSTKTQLGLQKTQVYDQDYGAVFSANPVELWYYTIYCWTPNTTQTVLIDVELRFECEFYDRAPAAISFKERGQRIKKLYSEILEKGQYRPDPKCLLESGAKIKTII